MPQIVYVTGVSGVGKSTIGKLLAEKLNLPFLEGDDFHPKENIEKMSAGFPLNDEDRFPWLRAIREAALEASTKKGAIISCSALKEKYRAILSDNFNSEVQWIHLTLKKEVIADRLNSRSDHFMPSELLDSQFSAFEEPTSGHVIINDADSSEVVARILVLI